MYLDSVVTAIAAILGVLIGGLISTRLTIMRTNYDDRTRFHEFRRELYTRFLSVSELAFEEVNKSKSLEDDLPNLENLNRIFIEAQLVASTDVLSVCTELVARLRYSTVSSQFTWSASGGEWGQRQLERHEFHEIRKRILETIRNEFGLEPKIPIYGDQY